MSAIQIHRETKGVPPELRWCWLCFATLALLSAGYTLIMTHVVHKPYPYGMPLFHADAPFWDFNVFRVRFEHFRSTAFWDVYNYPFTYPAMTGVVFAILYRSGHAVVLYEVVCGVALAIWVTALIAGLIRRAVAPVFAILFALTLLGTSWPVGYLLNRANIEGITAILAGCGVVAVWQRRWWLAAILMGCAAAMKLFPIILLGLLLSRRRYREFAGGLTVMAVATLASLQILGPSIGAAERHISGGLRFFEQNWAVPIMPEEIGFDHSLYTVIKLPVFIWYQLTHHDVVVNSVPGQVAMTNAARTVMELALQIYVAVTAALGVALYVLRIRKLPMLNQILALSVCMVLLPPVSFDYTLVHLSVPLAILCLDVAEQWRRRREPGANRSLFATFAFVLTMDAFLTLRFRWAGQFRALALTMLLVQVLRVPLGSDTGAPACELIRAE